MEIIVRYEHIVSKHCSDEATIFVISISESAVSSYKLNAAQKRLYPQHLAKIFSSTLAGIFSEGQMGFDSYQGGEFSLIIIKTPKSTNLAYAIPYVLLSCPPRYIKRKYLEIQHQTSIPHNSLYVHMQTFRLPHFHCNHDAKNCITILSSRASYHLNTVVHCIFLVYTSSFFPVASLHTSYCSFFLLC